MDSIKPCDEHKEEITKKGLYFYNIDKLCECKKCDNIEIFKKCYEETTEFRNINDFNLNYFYTLYDTFREYSMYISDSSRKLLNISVPSDVYKYEK